nr:MAG TPA: hypothetical protein [Caudoviricetes sp.]
MVNPKYELIQKLHALTSKYMELDDDLQNATRFSDLSMEIENTAMDLLRINTDISDDDMVKFLTEHHVYSVGDKVKVNGKFATITKVLREVRDRCNKVYAYEVELDGKAGYIINRNNIKY